MSSLSQSLRDAVKRLAFGASLDQLKRRGINKVNVLGLDRIVALIEEAVQRSLKNRFLGVERNAIADATKEEFLRLLKSNADLQKSRDELVQLQDRASAEIRELREELDRQQAELQRKLGVAVELDPGVDAAAQAAVRARIDALFVQHAKSGGTLSELQTDLNDLVQRMMAEERRTAFTARSAKRDSEIDLLQRRIGKMTQALEENEARMAEFSRMQAGDLGVSSVYREVQGLNTSANNYQKKKALMAEIFQANLALQKGLVEG